MSKVTSKDGTQIAYDQQGQGPAVILVDGALCYRGFGPMPEVAKLLAPHFTVYTYDRRGRGESGNTLPYSLEREVEDLAALIQQAGGSVYLYGISSGACLGLEAALRLDGKIQKLAIYEPPYRSGEGIKQEWEQYRQDIHSAVATGHPGDAVVRFMQLVGTPAEMTAGMRQSPMWPMFEAVGPTLEYDAAAMGADRAAPTQRAAAVAVPTLVMNGGAGFPFMQDTAVALAKAIPHAEHRVLKDQRHDVSAEAIAPVLIEFFKA